MKNKRLRLKNRWHNLAGARETVRVPLADTVRIIRLPVVVVCKTATAQWKPLLHPGLPVFGWLLLKL